MSTAHAHFLADLGTRPYVSGLNVMEVATSRSTKKIEKDFQGIDKSISSMRLGQVSMQVSDIAVQLDGGAKAATVLAQQGSQILQYFGPAGMIAGGVLAIGAGIYNWATGAKDANDEIKETMRLLGEVQSRRSQAIAGAASDARAATLAGMTGPRAEIGRLRFEFDEDMKRMEREFKSEPIHTRDFGLFDKQVAARRERFDAERDALYQKHEQDKEAKEAEKQRRADSAASKELREMEADQYRNFLKFREEMDAQEKEAREGLVESIKQAEKVEKENADRNERIGELQEQLGRATAKQAVQNQAANGQSIIDGAGEFLKPQSQRIAEREAGQAEERAINREISRRLDRADQHRRSIGSEGMTPEERESLREASRADVKTAKNKEKILASIDPDSIKELTNEINKLIAK